MRNRHLTPKKFYNALLGSGIFLISNNLDEDTRRRKVITAMIKAQEILRENFQDSNMQTQVSLAGQEHNVDRDYTAAVGLTLEVANQKGILVLESGGELHPGLNDQLTSIGEQGCSLVVTEHELHTDGGTTHFHFGEKERSWLVGMYVANEIMMSVITSMQAMTPITVIFGDNHILDIEIAIKNFLEYMQYSVQPNLRVIRSKSVSKPHQSRKPPLDIRELYDARNKIRTQPQRQDMAFKSCIQYLGIPDNFDPTLLTDLNRAVNLFLENDGSEERFHELLSPIIRQNADHNALVRQTIQILERNSGVDDFKPINKGNDFLERKHHPVSKFFPTLMQTHSHFQRYNEYMNKLNPRDKKEIENYLGQSVAEWKKERPHDDHITKVYLLNRILDHGDFEKVVGSNLQKTLEFMDLVIDELE
jgi:hypothetical protein